MMDIATISLFAILLFLAWKLFNWVWVQPRKMEKFFRNQGLRGNPYRLLYGDAKEISAMYDQAYSTTLGPYDDIVPRVMPFIAKSVRTYGKNLFAWIGPRPRIIISEADLMKVVLNKYRSYQKSFKASNKIIQLAIGGLVYFEGDEWTQSRAKLNPAFHVDKLKMKIAGIQECCENILNQWKNKMSEDGSGVIDVLYFLEDYSGSVVTQTLFSTPFSDEMRRNFHNLRDLTIMTDTASKPFNIPGIWYLPTARKRKAMALEKQVRKSFTSMINDRLRIRMGGKGDDQWDLLDLFLDELYDGKVSINNKERTKIIEEAIAQCKLFYFAGYDTTSNLLVWTLITLASHQRWQARAREEVSQVLGHSNNITYDSLNQLKIVSMILYEILRLYAPVMELSRVVEEDTELGGLRIPKGTFVQLPIALLHRDPEIWGEDSLEFKPDRFAEGVMKATNGQAAFMPFSWGPRICIGQNFALMEAKIFLAQLLCRFSFELAPTYKHAPYAAFTVQPQYGAPLMMKQI